MWLVGSLRSVDYGEGERAGGGVVGWGDRMGCGGWRLGAELGRCEEQGPLGRSSQTEPMTPPYWKRRGQKEKKKRKEGSHPPQVAIL